MGVLLGVAAALGFGSGDFLGGRASRRAPTVTVLLVALSAAVVVAVPVALVVDGDRTVRDLALGAAAGSVNVLGLGLLYQGLATGRMGIVAPVTAVAAAIVPITWGFLTGERPGPVAVLGVGCAVVAGALIAREPDPGGGDTSRALGLAVAAGVALGTSFVLFAETAEDSGFWPLLSARVAAIVLVAGVVVALTGRGIRFPSGGDRRLALGAGVLDVAATVCLLVAVRRGLMVLVAPLASLAPAFTVMLAWVVLREPVTRHQVGGLGLALAGLALIATGCA